MKNTNINTHTYSTDISKRTSVTKYMKLNNWHEGCKEYDLWIKTVSPKSRVTYNTLMGYFVKWSQQSPHPIGKIDEILKHPKETLNEMLEGYIMDCIDREVKRNTAKLYLATIGSFLDFHEVPYSHKKIKRLLPPKMPLAGKNAYKIEQIQAMLDNTSILRTKVIVILIACSGLRRGGLVDLKVGNLIPIEDCYVIRVHAGDVAEYVTFCTPECRELIEQYIDQRKNAGEDVTSESVLIQTADDTTDHGRNQVITYTLFRLLRKARIKKEKVGKNRYNISMAHGFRKFFDTALNKAKVPHNDIEKMQGHMNGLKGLYYDPEDTYLFELYKQAIPNLTILEKNRQKVTIAELKNKSVMDEVMITQQIMDMKQTIDRLEKTVLLYENDVKL